MFVAFDLLARDDEVLLELPYEERRAALEALVAAPVELTPMVRTAAEAERWLHEAEGVMAKELAAPYRPGKREGMVKIKRVRTIDAVVMGWRPGKAEGTVGALILGLYEPDGRLREVGHSSGFTAKEKRELVDVAAALRDRRARQRASPRAGPRAATCEWVALRPELVVEITFDHTSAGRIRHGAKVQRWREDKPPAECTRGPARQLSPRLTDRIPAVYEYRRYDGRDTRRHSPGPPRRPAPASGSSPRPGPSSSARASTPRASTRSPARPASRRAPSTRRSTPRPISS